MARRRHRRRRLGAITLRSRGAKIARQLEREEMQSRRKVRRLSVNVFTQRGDFVTDYGRKHGYWSWACTGKPAASGMRREIPGLAEKRRKTCGEDMWGKTPTAAVKRALVALGKKKELR